jgi:hypothetical protein
VIACSDIGLDAASFLQLIGKQLLGDLRGVELLAADGQRDVGDDVGGVELVLGGVGAIGARDVVDETFVKRPGIHPAFPIVDDRVAETKGLGLHVGRARGDPRGAGGTKILVRRLGQQLIDGQLQRPRRGESIGVTRLGDVGIGFEHVLGAHLLGAWLCGER